MEKHATSRTQARQLRNYECDAIKFLLAALLISFLAMPLLSGDLSSNSVISSIPVSEPRISSDDLLLTIQMTASSNGISTGNVSTYRGIVYSDDDADYLRFVDPINDVILNQSVESGELSEITITGIDIDEDGSTEFLILNNNGTSDNLLIVDFNDAITTSFNISIDSPSGIATGDFNGDSQLDVAIFGRYGVLTLDLQTSQVLGNFSFSGLALDACAIGRFLEPTQDSIALGIYNNVKDGNLSIVAGNGTLMRTKMMHTEIYGLATFDYGTGLDDLAVLMFDGNLTTILPDTMNAIFNTTGLPERSQVLTGILNHDNQEDLFVIPEMDNYTVFIDGSNGSIIRQSEVVYGSPAGSMGSDPSTLLCDSGFLDADNLTDFALMTAVGNNPGFLRGVDGEVGFYEPTISSKLEQLCTFDVNGNGRDDIIVVQSQTIYIILSDIQAPVLSPEPLSPPHPTIHDPFIEIEVGVEDNTTIILADIYLRHEGEYWVQPTDELQNAGTQYFAFLVGLSEGYYDYYLVFQDTYLNVGSLGNETHPLNFTIAGHLIWSDSKNQDSQFEHHLMDIGNASDGSEVIYTLDSTPHEIWLERYAARGEKQCLGLVANRTFSDFWIYTGMMDGDSILDPIIVLYNATTLTTNVSMYHGSTGSFWFSSQCPYENFSKPESFQIFDCDNDGIDEFLYVSKHRFENYAKMLKLSADGSWSSLNVTGQNAEFYSLSLGHTVNSRSTEACVSASSGPIDIINVTSMTLISTHSVTLPEYAFTVPVAVYPFSNESESTRNFLLYFYFMNPPNNVSSGFHVFDATTSRINETTLFYCPGRFFVQPTIKDFDSDGTDDIISPDYFTGNLIRITLANPIIVEWEVTISDSEFLSSVIVDFDGDSEDEFAVFTKEDETLRIFSLDGAIERTMIIGKGYGSLKLGNVDLGYGEEIVVYPLIQNDITKIGVIRDINLIRRLNASLTLPSENLLQGDSLEIDVDVTNIYSEIISDAKVYLTVHYLSGTSIINQTKALIFEANNYSTLVAVNWPIGVVNLSLQVNHILYDTWEEYYHNALTIRSPLDVEVYTRDVVLQNSTLSVNVTVTDSLGTRVPDAIVNVSMNGVNFATTYVNTQYRLLVPNIDLIPGEYLVNSTVIHDFASVVASESTELRVETDELRFDRNIPSLTEQDEQFYGWLNITDIFGNPIENAQVMMVSGIYELTLTESSPGCYLLDTIANFKIGNHTFDISVEHEFIRGFDFGEVQIVTKGNLLSEVPELPPVGGGEEFAVTVYISDNYGSAPADTWIILEIDGKNITASQSTIGRYTAVLNATYCVGEWNFIVYYGSDYSYSGKMVCDIKVMSAPILAVIPSEEWSVGQGNETTLEVHVKDWLSTDIMAASVSVLIRGSTYTLEYITGSLYRTNISTIGWPYGFHPYYITINHEFLHETKQDGNLAVIADPVIIIRTSPVVPEQYSDLVVIVEVTDLYENPVTDLLVMIEFVYMNKKAEETSVRGTYSVTFQVGNTHHGYYNLLVSIDGMLSVPRYSSEVVFVEVFVPGMEALSVSQLSLAASFALLLSIIGMILFVKVSSVVTTSSRKTEEVTSSITQLDRIYAVIVASTGLLFLHSWWLFTVGEIGFALIEGIILLGCSVLLYGLWLYRDAYSSILLQGQLSKRRIVLGVWHLILVPFIVYIIFFYGGFHEMFQRWIIEIPHVVVGELSFPPILATVLATYFTSIVVVVVSFYREIRKGLGRIDDMIAAGTPKHVVDEEQALLIGRTGSSIRIKFLMFLLILGATTIMQLEFLKNYSMAAIVLIPVVFLVLIPFASSRIVRKFSAMRVSTHDEIDTEKSKLLSEEGATIKENHHEDKITEE